MDSEGMPRLTLQELAAEAGSEPERVEELIGIGVLAAGADGRFNRGDVLRVAVANDVEQAGLSLELMRRGIEAGIVSFAQTPEIYPDIGERSATTVAELADRLGLPTETLLRVITAFGLPRPDPDQRLRGEAEDHLTAFVQAWRPIAGGDESIMLRAARTYGDAVRRIAEGWTSLFEEAVLNPVRDRALQWEEMRDLAVGPGLAILAVARGMLTWMVDQHHAQALNQLNLESIERELAAAGIKADAPRSPAAVVFADLSGYTRLTEERGDEVAAGAATRLAELADEIARRLRGRLVKLLGDGVMLHFPHPTDALHAAIALLDAMEPAGLPPAHIGIDAGRVVRREADFYGRVVNIASRLAGSAAAGEILVSGAFAEAVRGDAAHAKLEPLEPLQLKGVPEPVPAYRVRGAG